MSRSGSEMDSVEENCRGKALGWHKASRVPLGSSPEPVPTEVNNRGHPSLAPNVQNWSMPHREGRRIAKDRALALLSISRNTSGSAPEAAKCPAGDSRAHAAR